MRPSSLPMEASPTIRPAILVPLLVLLAGIALWPLLESDTLYAVAPIAAYLILLLLLLGYRAPESRLQELLSKGELLWATLGAAAVTLLSASLLLIAIESVHIDNTLEGLNLFRLSLVAGAPVGVMIWIKLSKALGLRNIVLLKSFLISFALLTATAASQLNRKAGDPESVELMAEVIEKRRDTPGVLSHLADTSPPNYLIIPYEHATERLVVPREVWETLYASARVTLTVQPGYLGYEYVARFNGRP